MSRKISNILVICAMVVIFPLLVIGSAFAAYYSINASVKVAIYADVPSDTATITLSSGAKDYSEDFELTGSHVSEVTVRAKSVGYNFVGWYNGTAEQYEADIDKKFISEEDVFKAKLSDYENVLAVFEIKKYAVTYSYLADPTDTANTVEVAPTAAETTNNVAGKTTYNYGDVLPMLKTEKHYSFKGWVVNNVTYKKAVFTTAETYTMTATVANGAWIENERTTVVYKINDTDYTEEAATYANEDYDLPAIEEVRDGENKLTGYKVTINGEGKELTIPAEGERWAWVDENNNEVTKVSQNATVTLKKVDVRYTINVVNGADITYAGLNGKNFKYSDLDLEYVFNDDNYNTTYSFWKLGNVVYEGTNYSKNGETNNKATLTNKIKDGNAHNDATITLTANVKKNFANVTVTALNFYSESQSGFTNPTYQKVSGIFSEMEQSTIDITASTTTVAQWLDIDDQTFYSAEDETATVTPVGISVTYGTLNAQIPLEEVSTINDIMEKLYNKNPSLVTLGADISITVDVYLR